MNQLKMDIQQTINRLTRSSWSQRRIARELGIDRGTVARYRRLAPQAEEPNPAIPPAGPEAVEGAKAAIVLPGWEVTTVPSNPSTQPANPAIPPAGSEPAEGARPAIVPPRLRGDDGAEQPFSPDANVRNINPLAGAGEIGEIHARDVREIRATIRKSSDEE